MSLRDISCSSSQNWSAAALGVPSPPSISWLFGRPTPGGGSYISSLHMCSWSNIHKYPIPVHSFSLNWPGPQITWKLNMQHTKPQNFKFVCIFARKIQFSWIFTRYEIIAIRWRNMTKLEITYVQGVFFSLVPPLKSSKYKKVKPG